jgi:hypothetical protein
MAIMVTHKIVRVGWVVTDGVFFKEENKTTVHQYGCRKSTEVYELI